MSGTNDGKATRFPVSIKSVLFIDGKVVLLKNERDEWELPGGKLEPGERPTDCLAREIREELGIDVEVGRILDCWLYNILGRTEVLIVTYLCAPKDSIHTDDLTISSEHKQLRFFGPAELTSLRIPAGYKESVIRAWRA